MSEMPVFDYDKLMASTVEDEELAREVVGVVILEVPVLLMSLEAAVGEGKALDAQRDSHSIKGIAATAGGERLREVAFQCERLAQAGNLREVEELLPQLRDEYEAYEQALRKMGLV